MKNWKEKLGLKIRNIRIDKNLSVKEISKYTGLSINKIYKIERGKNDFYLSEIEKISNVLNFSVIDILKSLGL